MKTFYRVQFKAKGKRGWTDTKWGSIERKQNYDELSLKDARRSLSPLWISTIRKAFHSDDRL